MDKQKEKKSEKNESKLGKVTNVISNIVSNPKVKGAINFGKSGYKCYETFDAISNNKVDDLLQKRAVKYISDETATALVSGLGSLIPALGTGLLPVVGVLACSFLIGYGLSKL